MIRWVFIFLFAFTSAVFAQDDDAGFIQRTLESALSGDDRTVTLKGFSGALSSRATIEEISVADGDGVWLTLENVAMEWRRAALLRGRVEIDALTAERISLPRVPKSSDKASVADSEATPFSLPDLPVSVNIGQIEAEKVDIGQEIVGEAAEFSIDGSLNLSDGEGMVDLNIKRLDKTAKFILEGGFSNETRKLKINLDLSEGKDGFAAKMIGLPGNPAIDMTLKGAAPIDDFEAKLKLQTDGVERVTGGLRLTAVKTEGEGPAPQRIRVDLIGDVTPMIPDEYAPFFGTDSHVIADIFSYGGTRIDVEKLDVSAAELDLKGSLSVKEDGLPARFDLIGTLGRGEAVRLPISGTPTYVNKVDFTAKYDETKGDKWTLNFVADQFRQDPVQIAQITLNGRGKIGAQSPRFVDGALDFTIKGFDHSDPALVKAIGRDVNGVANLAWSEGQNLQVSHFEMTGAGLVATLKGVFGAFKDGLPFDGSLRVQADDISRFSGISNRRLSGAVDAEMVGQVQLLSQIFDVDIEATTEDLRADIPQVDRLLSGQGKLNINLRRDDLGTLLAPLTITTDALQAEMRGGLNSKMGRGILRAQLDDLGRVDNRLSGPGSLKVRADWTKGADIRIHDLLLVLGDTQLDGQGRFWPESEEKNFEGNVHLVSPDISTLSRLAGRPLRGNVELAMNGKGALQDQTFDLRGSLTGSNLATGVEAADQLLKGNVWMRVDVGRNGDTVDVRAFEIDTPEITANATGTYGGGQPLRLSARLSDLGMFLPEFSGPVTASGEMRVSSMTAEQIDLAMQMTGPGGVTANVNGAVLEQGQDLDMRLTGTFPMGVANKFITPRSVQGNANFDLTLQGPPGLDALNGTLTANRARLALPKLQMAVDDITAKVDLVGGQAQLDVGGELRSGGRLTVKGPLSLLPPNQADLDINLDGVIFEDPELYRTKVNGDIKIAGPLATGGRISGKLRLPRTDIQVPSSGITSLGAIPDINHINEPATVRASRKRAGLLEEEGDAENGDDQGPVYDLDLTIKSGNEIFVRGRGLDAELGGEMRLGGTTKNVVPSGYFDLLRGRLDILGKRLDLTDGRITLQGDFDAYIHFVAENYTEDATLQIIIDGLVSDPEVQFTSQPDMPEEEVVARLLFGRGLDQLSPFQAARLAAAVAALVGNGNADVLGNLRDSTGLANLDVNTNEEGNAEVTAGFYLSDKVYSEVAVDDEGESEVNIKLDLSKSVTVKGVVESRGNTGIGIFFEKDY